MQHQRRILLINRKFQLKFSIFICLWVAILSLALPFGLHSEMHSFMQVLSRSASPEALQQIQNFYSGMFRVYIAAVCIAVGILFWLCLVLSHRIAGPMYRIQTALERWKRGNIEHHLKLRKDDHFKELADAYNDAALEYIELRNQVRKVCEKLETLSQDLDMKHRAQIHEMTGDLQCSNPKKS